MTPPASPSCMSLVTLSEPKNPMTYSAMSPVTAQLLAYQKAPKLGDKKPNGTAA